MKKICPWWNVATSKTQATSGLFVVDSLGIAWSVDGLQIAWTVKACRWLERKQAVWHEETELIISMSGQSTTSQDAKGRSECSGKFANPHLLKAFGRYIPGQD